MVMRLEERFWKKVKRGASDKCWMWQAARTKYGYGQFPRGPKGAGWDAAHRVAWMLERGPIPVGAWVLHHCDNPPCVNPSHLFLGDSDANVADMVQKQRHRPRGNVPVRIGERQRRLAAITGGPWASRTQCIHGHWYTPENTYIRPKSGHRDCRTCIRERSRRHYQAKKTA